MGPQYFIYGYIDPRKERLGELRWIGQSAVGMKRPSQIHKNKCGSWQKNLRSLGLKEETIIIEEWPGDCDWKQWLDETETFYIAYFRMIGADLKNITYGGSGVGRGVHHPFYGKKQTPEAVEKIREAARKQIRTAERNAKISASLRGKQIGMKRGPYSAEHRAKISASLTGKPSKAPWKGKRRSDEVRAKISATKRMRSGK